MSTDEFKSQSVTSGDPQDLFNLVAKAVDKSYTASGCKAPDKSNEIEVEAYNDMINYLVFYIRKRFTTMQFRDVTAAIQFGAVGEYGEFYGINTKSLVKFLTSFYNSEEHKKEVKKRIILYQPMSNKPTDEERFNVGKSLVLRAFEAHKNNEPIERLGAINYDFLNSLELITYSKEQKIAIFETALPAVMAERAEKSQRENSIRDLIKRFELSPEKGTPDHALVVLKGKALTTTKYFEDCILANIDLAGVIEGKRELFYSLNK